MSILKNFVNPWESTEALGSQALGTEALEGNVIEDFTSKNDDTQPIVATYNIDKGKGNLMIIFYLELENEYRHKYKEVYSKRDLERGNEMWDYVTVEQELGNAKDWIEKYKKEIS